MINLKIIRFIIEWMWNNHYPVNSLRMGFNDMLKVFDDEKIKHGCKRFRTGLYEE